jgi:hypothetical protein
MYFLDAVYVWVLIVLIFIRYTTVAIIIVMIPIPTETIPIILASISPAGDRLSFILKCRFVTKKLTPIMAIAVLIQAKHVLSFAKCC